MRTEKVGRFRLAAGMERTMAPAFCGSEADTLFSRPAGAGK
nr:MAG TPA: hypothetical protein [Caudoviricetes sp.]